MIAQKKYARPSFIRLFSFGEFLPTAILILLTTLTLAFSLSYMVYKSYHKELRRNLTLKAALIDKTLSEMFDETNRLMVYVGKQIARHDKGQDLNFIANLLASVSEADFKTKSSITFLEWVDHNNLQVVNSQTGIVPDPVDMSFRDYTNLCPKYPWTLQVSKPGLGIPSGLWVIPAGTGVFNTKGDRFLGMVTAGFSVTGLNTKLSQALLPDQASYVILDADYNIILHSEDHELDPSSLFYKDTLKDQPILKEKEGWLAKRVKYKNIEYSHYKRMSHYPYFVLVGYDRNITSKGFYALVLPRIVEFGGMALFCLLLLYFSRKRLISIYNTSHKAKEEFLRKFNDEFRSLLSTISQHLEVLVRHNNKEDPLILPPNKQIELMKSIQEAILNIHNLTTTTLHLSSLDVNKLLSDCILIHSQVAFSQGKKIVSKLQDSLPPIHLDELRFKQIILGLLSISLKCTPKGASITVFSSLRKENNEVYLVIGISDNGLGLSTEELIRIREKFKFRGLNHQIDGTELDIQEIIRLVEMHDGTYSEHSEISKGRDILLFFPYHETNYSHDLQVSEENSPSSNVYQFVRKS